MLRTTIVCLIALALQISALPEFIENLEHDLTQVPEEYQYLAEEIQSKRAATNDRETGFCCSNWQHVNNDEVITKIQTSLVPKTQTVTTGYQDCHGNVNPTPPPIPIPVPVKESTKRPSLIFGGATTPSTPGGPGTSCMWKPITKIETYMTTEHTVVTHLVPNSQTYCAPEDYKCCPGYVMLNGGCVDGSVVSNLEFLMHLGLIGGVGKK